MRARQQSGQYTGHNTPGDGTGFTKLPESDAQEFMTKQRPEPDSTVPGTNGAQRFEPVRAKG